jgi:hypothetical protein
MGFNSAFKGLIQLHMAICYTVYTLVWALVHRARWLGSPVSFVHVRMWVLVPRWGLYSAGFSVWACPAIGVGVALPVLLGADRTFFEVCLSCWVVPRCLYGTVGSPYHWVTGCTWIFLLTVITSYCYHKYSPTTVHGVQELILMYRQYNI